MRLDDFDVAFYGNTVKNVALSLSIVGHTWHNATVQWTFLDNCIMDIFGQLYNGHFWTIV